MRRIRLQRSAVVAWWLAAALGAWGADAAVAQDEAAVVPTFSYTGFFDETAAADPADASASEVSHDATEFGACDACQVECAPPCLPPPCSDLYRLRFPTAYTWVEGLVLERDNDARNRPLVLDLNTDDVLLTTGDLDFDWSGGLRAGIACREADSWGLEFVYLGYFDQAASVHVTSNDDLTLPGSLGLQVNNFFAADSVHVHYTSDINSGEANVICSCVGCDRSLEWLAGFRYLYLGEGVGITAFDSEESTTRYNVGTNNNLVGAQLGARGYRRAGSFACEATGKAGVYANFMEQKQAPIVDFPDFVFRPARSSDDADAAFVSDLNLSGIYQLTDVWGLRAGYNVIWIEGVALAADQLDFTNNGGSGRRLVSGGSVFLHGVNAGIEARW